MTGKYSQRPIMKNKKKILVFFLKKKMYGSAATPLRTIIERTKASQTVRGRMDEIVLKAIDSILQDIPINLSALSSVYAQVKNTT